MKLFLTSVVTGFLLSSALSASIIFTREAPGVQSTTVAGTTTETFNSLTPGTAGPVSSPIGTYSGGIIVAPDIYGGANQTNYISVGVQSGTMSYSVNFGSLKTYFGFFWEAADFDDSVAFYNGAVLQATFTPSDILAGLPSAYYGNPNTGSDPFEAFVYLNFTSTDLASRFDRVVFMNGNLLTGFETDNHSTYDQIIPPPGVPEPSTYALMATGTLCMIGFARKRRKQNQ